MSIDPGIRRIQRTSKGSLFFFAFAAWAVGSTIVSLACAGAGAHAHARFDAEKGLAELRCARTHASAQPDPWCGTPGAQPPVLADYKDVKAELDAARRAGDRSAEAAAVARAFEHAGAYNHRRTPIMSLAAAKLIEEAADRLDAEPALRGDPRVRAALAKTRLNAALAPFASERALALASLARVPGTGRIPDLAITQTATGMVMQEVDETLAAMEASVLAGDVKACQQTITTARPLVRSLVSGPASCVNAERVVHAGHRLASLRTRADAGASRARAARYVTDSDRPTR
jgi:hypothetical protein